MKYFIILFFISIFFIFLKVGTYLDSTSVVSKTDLIVVLGGGFHKNRVKKALDIYNSGYLKGNSIILTGIPGYYKNMKKDFGNKISLLLKENVKNTMEEVLYIKDYINKNKSIRSVIFITEVPHSRRVKIFWDNFGESMKSIKFSVVASDLPKWDSKNYYKNKFSREYAFTEVLKLIYNFFIYAVLDKLELKDDFEIMYEDKIQQTKKELMKTIKEY